MTRTTAQPIAPVRKPRSSRQVLVVDDDRMLREVLIGALEDEGYTVRAARNGREALALLEHWQPDVILLDLMMPIMNGWEFRSEQLRDPKLSSIPVVIMTADGSASEKARSLYTDYLRKPIHLDALLALVNDYCGS
jgi:CheY-like chemotaxis protein